MNAPRKKTSTEPSGRHYTSVADLLRGEKACGKLQSEFAKLASQNRISTLLAVARSQAGMTQQDLAKQIGRTQSSVSKIERTPDRDITLGVIQDYAKATGSRFVLSCGKPMSHVEAVKNHAQSIRQHLDALANIAQKHDELQPHIQGFFGEAFFNILSILTECQVRLPGNQNDFEIRITASKNESAQPKRRSLRGMAPSRR